MFLVVLRNCSVLLWFVWMLSFFAFLECSMFFSVSTPPKAKVNMDELVDTCFLRALHLCVRDSDLPMDCSKFYSGCMLPSRPAQRRGAPAAAVKVQSGEGRGGKARTQRDLCSAIGHILKAVRRRLERSARRRMPVGREAMRSIIPGRHERLRRTPSRSVQIEDARRLLAAIGG